jgi:Tol biopolymer transport system component
VAKIGLLGRMSVAVSDGGMLLYSATNVLSRFTWIDRTGKPLRIVGEPGEYTSIFRLSPDGRRVVVSRDGPGGSDLWVTEVERGVSLRLTTSSINYYPLWSPDGRTIVFSSGSPRNLFREESSGAGKEERLSQSAASQFPSDWSGDGGLILYAEIAPHTGRDLWVLPVTPEGKLVPDAKARPYLLTTFNEWGGRFSPEAHPRWVAYQSDETGKYEIYIRAFPEPRAKFQISTGGGEYPQWGAGGRELYYLSRDNKLMVVSLKFGSDSVEPSAPRELLRMPAYETGWSPYDTAADGQRFLVRATTGQAAQALTLIVNWPALLKKGGADSAAFGSER